MDRAPDSFAFFQVPSQLAVQAYTFHKSQSGNEHIWPRSGEQIQEYARDGELFGVRMSNTAEFAGLCYGILNGENGNEWEIGGLTVPTAMRHLHLGTFLVRFAVAHTIAMQRPWHNQQEVIAYVHKENDKPRNLLGLVGFEFWESIFIPGDKAPSSMKRNADGNVPGHKFRFPPRAVEGLSNWFEHEFRGVLDDGMNGAAFEILGGMDALIEALREAVTELKDT